MKKTYYVPGLISALLLPLLFWYFGNQRLHPQFTVLDLGIPAKYDPKVPKEMTFEWIRNWDYKKIIVPPNKALQNQDQYVSELKKLQARNERETGIEFVIGNQNTYQDFITLINAMKLSQQESYGLDINKTGHLFAVHFEQPKAIKYVCGGVVMNEYNEDKASLNLIKPETYANHLPKQSFYIIFGFLLFLNISMLSIKEKFQLHHV